MAQTTNYLLRKQLPKQNTHNKFKLPKLSQLTHPQQVRACSQENSKGMIEKCNQSPIEQPEQKQMKKQELISISVEINRLEHKDTDFVEDYFQEYFQSMMEQEEKNYKLRNYMNTQVQINQKMRGNLLNWIIELHHKLKMVPQTLYTTTMIIDLYISKKQATKENLLLIGASAFYIAYKYEEAYHVPKLDDLVNFTDKKITKDQIVNMEGDIICTLNFNLNMKTSFIYFQPLGKLCKMEDKDFHLAQYVLELALLDSKFLEYKPSLIASSSIYLVNKVRKKVKRWPSDLENLTNYTQESLKNCVRELYHLLIKIDDLQNTKAIKKKFSLPQYHEVSRQKFEIKKQ